MGRLTAIPSVWLLGFALGFLANLVYPPLSNFMQGLLPTIFIDPRITATFLSGLIGSVIATLLAGVWIYLPKGPRK